MMALCLLLSLLAWITNDAYRVSVRNIVSSRFLRICQAKPAHDSYEWLSNYNRNYLQRQKIGRSQGKAESYVEFEYLQQVVRLENRPLQQYYQEISDHLLVLKDLSRELILGIKAETGSLGVSVLSNWVTSLKLPRGLLYSYDSLGKEVLPTQLNEMPVYIKYNSTDFGHAVMNPYNGAAFGVIFQGILSIPRSTSSEGFYQFGDFPLYVFNKKA